MLPCFAKPIPRNPKSDSKRPSGSLSPISKLKENMWFKKLKKKQWMNSEWHINEKVDMDNNNLIKLV